MAKTAKDALAEVLVAVTNIQQMVNQGLHRQLNSTSILQHANTGLKNVIYNMRQDPTVKKCMPSWVKEMEGI